MYSAKKGICCAWWGGGGHCLEKRPTRDWMPAPNATPASPTNLDSLPQVERSFLHHHQQQHLPKMQNQSMQKVPTAVAPVARFKSDCIKSQEGSLAHGCFFLQSRWPPSKICNLCERQVGNGIWNQNCWHWYSLKKKHASGGEKVVRLDCGAIAAYSSAQKHLCRNSAFALK